MRLPGRRISSYKRFWIALAFREIIADSAQQGVLSLSLPSACLPDPSPPLPSACCLGAGVIGDEALIASIIEGGAKAVAFDKLIATPEFIKPLAKAGRVSGPGLRMDQQVGNDPGACFGKEGDRVRVFDG